MPAQLVALDDAPDILVDKPILLLGRHPECDIQIESRKVSRRHCCIAQINDYLVIRDLDSTNGIRINGVRVIEGQLRPGDEVTIGNFHYRVASEEAAPVERRATHPRSLESADLEECDEPVALPEPARPPRRPAAPAPGPGATRPAPADDDSLVLPDELQLRPGSGAVSPDRPGGK